MNPIKDILNELLQNTDQMKAGQVLFVQSVNRYFKRNKKVSDKQLLVLREIRGELNKTCTVEVGLIIFEKIPEAMKIKKSPLAGGQRN